MYMLLCCFFLGAFVLLVRYGVSKEVVEVGFAAFGLGVMGTVVTAMIFSAH